MKRPRGFAPVAFGLVGLLLALSSGSAGAQVGTPPSCKLNASPTTTPPGGTVALQGTCINTTGATLYQWGGPGTAPCSIKSTSCNIVAPLAPGTYFYTITPSGGFPGNATVVVTAAPPPPPPPPPPTASCALSASPTNPAPNAIVQLHGTCINLPAGSSFAWTGPGTNVCSTTSADCAVNAPGAPGPVTYTLIAAFQSGATPPASATIDVSANLTLILVSGNDQAAPPGQPLANPLVVRLVDSQGRPVTGVSVSWSGSNPRDALSATSVATDSSGLSSIAVTLGSDPGDRTFTATAFKSSVVFTVRDLNRVLMKPAQQLLVPMTRTAITATRTQLETVAQHLDDVRRTCSSSAGGGGGDATVNGQSLGKVPWDGFVAGEISVGRQATTGEQSGYKLTTKSITVGTDLSCGGNYIIGVAVGFFRSDSRQDDGSGDQDAKGASASLWGSFAPFTDAYVDVVANFGQGHYDSQRRTTLAELSAGTHGDQAAVAARAGYSFKSGRTQFDPYYSVEHIEARVDGFSESGGIDAIAVSDVKVKSTVQTFGGKLRHTFDTSWGEITPHARVEVSRQTQDSGDSVAVQLVASPGVTQAMTLPQQNHSYGIFALGASGIYDKRYEWYLNYERSFGNDFQVSAFTARLRLQF